MRRSLIDAGPLIALFDNSDQHHQRSYEFIKQFTGRLISVWPVLTEVCYMLDFSKQTQLDFLDWITEGGMEIKNLDQWQISNLRNRIETYADLPADLADVSLMEIAQTENIDSIITLDHHFSVYKLSNGQSLENLLI